MNIFARFARLFGSRAAAGRAVPVVRVPRRRPRIVELEDEGSFASAVQQAGARDVWVVIEVADDRAERSTTHEIEGRLVTLPVIGRDWRIVERRRERWRATYEGGVPIPNEAELREVAVRHGARYARASLRLIPLQSTAT